MTKLVRIENADTSNYKVRVKVQTYNDTTQEWSDTGEVYALDSPAAMKESYLTSHRRLIVEETHHE